MELLVVLGVFGLLVAGALVPGTYLLLGGAASVVIGFGFGVPTGIVYHILLYRALKRQGRLPEGWIWRPLSLNRELPPESRLGVLVWCYAGAVGFAVIVLGLAMMGLGVLKQGTGRAPLG